MTKKICLKNLFIKNKKLNMRNDRNYFVVVVIYFKLNLISKNSIFILNHFYINISRNINYLFINVKIFFETYAFIFII